MEIHLFEIAGKAAEALSSPYLLVLAALVGFALASGTAGRVAIRIEDFVSGAANRQTVDD